MTTLSIPGVRLHPLTLHSDPRGAFVEIAREADFPHPFVQMNHSHSKRGVLRGLHYHLKQADLWYVVTGRAQVALVDLRDEEGAIETLQLSDAAPATLYIPPGIAHGFLALEELDLVYAVSAYYDASDEHGIAWNDPDLTVPWAVEDPILSERDAANLPWDRRPIPPPS